MIEASCDCAAEAMEALMRIERKQCLASETQGDTKGNGYYTRMPKVLTQKLQINVPRDHKGVCSPMMREVMKKESLSHA